MDRLFVNIFCTYSSNFERNSSLQGDLALRSISSSLSVDGVVPGAPRVHYFTLGKWKPTGQPPTSYDFKQLSVQLTMSVCLFVSVSPISTALPNTKKSQNNMFLLSFIIIWFYFYSSGVTPSTCPGFLCDNNLCLTKSKRCDHIQDCSDGSDEKNCSKYYMM